MIPTPFDPSQQLQQTVDTAKSNVFNVILIGAAILLGVGFLVKKAGR